MIANCPFSKMKIIFEAMIGLKKSFQMVYSNIGFNSCETVPLKEQFFKKLTRTSHFYHIEC